MLERFFAGVLTQLQAEVDLINSLVPHQGTKGSLNEESLRRILTSFLPSKYTLGTGFVIDSLGSRSRQVDIIIFDELNSSKLFRNFSQVLYPVESVFACIEVKTSTDKADLAEIAQENRAIAALKHYAPVVNSLRPHPTIPHTIETSALNTKPPLTFLVSYHTGSANPLTVRSWFEECGEKEFLPDIALFLDLGMVAIRPKSTEKETFDFLLMPARSVDLGDSDPSVLYLPAPCFTTTLNGRPYRSSRWKGKNGNYPIIMPEKALLTFLVQVSRSLDAFPKYESFDPTSYLPKYSDEGLEVLNNN